MTITDIIKLSELLGQMADIKRATKLPNGEFEPDSHHSFSLALIAYQICMAEKLDLDINKVVLYALAHDLLEIITGDVDTHHATDKQLEQKRLDETKAATQFEKLFESYPDLRVALHEYERLDTKEATTVFVLDKACTTWTYHTAAGSEDGHQRGINTRQDVILWEERKRRVLERRLNAEPPKQIIEIYEESFAALKDLYDK